MKLLLQTAVVPNAAADLAPMTANVPPTAPAALASEGPPLMLLGLAIAAPFLVLPALSAFHEQALHRLAVSDYTFHPVHVNFVYG
ncbi:MAG: hypothetical protein E6K18_05970 [Methanobacteriota archaeon]|nr:MAG: hypothetical protein E6K18_05970 [Euryarchaeota archaeon]